MERLPEGFKRIGYDSDSAKFTFRDRNGCLYQGEAGADYGILTPMAAALSSESSRPNAFSSGMFSILYTIQLIHSSMLDSSSVVPQSRKSAPCKEDSTFHDFLPSQFITTSSLSKTNQTPPKSSTAQQNFVKTVRKSLLPKMQDVVHNIRRSVTSIRRTRPTFPDDMRKTEPDETRGLVRSDSSSSSLLPSPDTPRRSKTIATSRPRSKYPSS